MNHSTATQEVRKGQVIKENTMPTWQAVSSPSIFLNLGHSINTKLHLNYKYFENERPIIIDHIAIIS